MSLSANMFYLAFKALVEKWCEYYFYSYLIELIRHISLPL